MLNEKEARSLLEKEDFSFVKHRLLIKKEDGGLGWSEEKADLIEDQYKAFLFVCWKYNDAYNVPSKDIDEFWHSHILFTRSYKNLCDRLYGYFLHHQPDNEVFVKNVKESLNK